MKFIKSISLKYPGYASIIITCLGCLVLLLPVKNFFIYFTGEYTYTARYLTGFFIRSFSAGIIVLYLYKIGFKHTLRFNYEFRNWFVIFPFLLLIAGNSPIYQISQGAVIDRTNPSIFIFLGLKCLGVGLFEEFLFRGAITSLLLHKWRNAKNGLYIAVVTSGILFGCMHLINLAKGFDIFAATLIQVFYTAFLGILISAVYLKTKNLWLVVLLHAVYNFSGEIPLISPVQSANNIMLLLNAAAFIPFMLFGVYTLRKINKDLKSSDSAL